MYFVKSAWIGNNDQVVSCICVMSVAMSAAAYNTFPMNFKKLTMILNSILRFFGS